jgi:RNA polymerase sigma factor (sigma-70 family)
MAEKEIKSLFLAYYNELRHYLTKKFQDKDLADDLTQETFLHYSEYNRTHPSAVILHKRSYLYRTAHNLAVDYIRRQQREQLDFIADDELPEVVSELPTPEQTFFNRDELAQAWAILSTLPLRTRQVFNAVRIERLTYREAAEQLGISESSVQKHLAAALKAVIQGMREK